MDLENLPEPMPVDDARCMKLTLAAALVLGKKDATPLERQWAREVFDLAHALSEARQED